MTWLGNANSAFGWLGRIWASRNISTQIKVRLYELLVLEVLLYGAETWPMKRATARKLEAAPSLVAQEDSMYFVERQGDKQQSPGTHPTGKVGGHHQRTE